MEKSHHGKRKTEEKSKKHSSKDSHEKEDKNIRAIVKKLIKHDASSETELPELFDTLDNGGDVDISELEDEYVKHKLYKLFKLFEVPHRTAKYVFKLEKKSSHSLKSRIESIIKRYMKKYHDKADNGKDRREPSKKFKEQASEEAEQNAASAEVNEGFVGPLTPSELNELRNKQKKILLEQYNSIFRPRSLLEEHQAKMKGKRQEHTMKKGERLKEFMARPFNRDTDLDVTRVGSKQAFKSMRDGGTLDSKFASSHFLHDN
eukprot:TRINITY_DN1223_c0_g2_i1.p1 TRINITY_DN1223_c0_g2~~TRINITY_DN1223_c0_g2_i1.p1  ORF type:complete len:261 (+),score=69.32 TRINITY_DN1223_c0_g2_i1:100-882(+)